MDFFMFYCYGISRIHPVIYKLLNKNINIYQYISLYIFICGIFSLLYLTLNYKSTINYTKNNFTNFKYITALSLFILIFKKFVCIFMQFL